MHRPCSKPASCRAYRLPTIAAPSRAAAAPPGRPRAPRSRRLAAWASARTSTRFGPERPLILGGVEIEGAPRLAGHSDGDVALHAVADALLGASGMGDLGRLFPADARTPRGIASAELLRDVVARLAAVGLRPVGVDLVDHRRPPPARGEAVAMRDAVAALLGLPAANVNVKASTGNLAGDEGAGLSSAARAGPRPSGGGNQMTIRLTDTLSGETRPTRAHRARARPDVQLRTHGLRPRARRQLPVLPVRRPARPVPALSRLRVTWVMNLTDIDDKIIRGANRRGHLDRRAGRPYPASSWTPPPSA